MSENASATTVHPLAPPRAEGRRLGLLLGLLTAFALRLYHLGSESLWYDETVSVLLARKSIPALLTHTAGDIHPPGYYLLLHVWQQLTTPSLRHGLEFLFAWPSLWWGVLIVALTYALGRRLFQKPIAFLALWLAAIHPYQIWYSQEVRMYTLGALLGLLAFWALLRYFGVRTPGTLTTKQPVGQRRWLLCYALCGALGLYTLYYFLFLLLSLNVIALWVLFSAWRTNSATAAVIPAQERSHWRLLAFGWIKAHLLLLLLWLPWLPIFWRQATNPPVPPWRAMDSLRVVLSESVSALLSGQSAPAPAHWIWLLVALLFFAVALVQYATYRAERLSLLLVSIYTLLPLATLLTLSVVVTPLYHSRYLMLYAPPLVLLLAALLQNIYTRHRLLAGGLLLLLVTVNGWSLRAFWVDPAFQSDDHRAAVAQLAAEWRPGDLILVNAGWVYSALQTYWPTELSDANAATPPPLQAIVRLHDYAADVAQTEGTATGPIVVRSGSVDGAAQLGWGDPASDFFALDAAATTAALQTLRQHYTRIWHYRLYDTVNDPNALIRHWLEDQGTRLLDQPIAGRDFLRLQLYRVANDDGSSGDLVAPEEQPSIAGLQLLAATPVSPTVAAGDNAYLFTHWQRNHDAADLPAVVSVSLRLYDERGVLLAQQDETPLTQPAHWSTESPTALTLALPISVATQPGLYSVQLLLYDGSTGAALAPSGSQDLQVAVGTLTVAPAQRAPRLGAPLLRFDYIDLLALEGGQPLGADATIPLRLLWRPQPNPYRDTYAMVWTLRDQAGTAQQQWEEPLGSWHYPSGSWLAGQPLWQQSLLSLQPTLNAGTYQLTMQLIRNSDGEAITPHRPWWQWRPWRPATGPTIQPDATLLVAEILIP